MSRMLITFFFTYVITRLFFWLSGFVPYRDLPTVPGYLVDLGIWLLIGNANISEFVRKRGLQKKHLTFAAQ